MKSEWQHRLEVLTVVSKKGACLELMARVRESCIGHPENPFTTGTIFGQYLVELTEQESKLNAEGEAYDKAKDAELEATKDESFPF